MILWYVVGLWLIFQTGLTLAKQFWGFQLGLNVPLTTGFMGFFLLGHLLGPWRLSRFSILLAASIWVLCFAGLASIPLTIALMRGLGGLFGTRPRRLRSF